MLVLLAEVCQLQRNPLRGVARKKVCKIPCKTELSKKCFLLKTIEEFNSLPAGVASNEVFSAFLVEVDKNSCFVFIVALHV